MENKCPLCGSEDIKLEIQDTQLTESFAGFSLVPINNYVCNSCGFEGDFFKENDELLDAEIGKLKIKSVKNIIDFLVKHNGISMASMERILDIPSRTMAKWKAGGKPNASAIALLKFIRLYPWLLEVAEHNFDVLAAQKIYLHSATHAIIDQINIVNGNQGFAAYQTFGGGQSASIMMTGEPLNNSTPASEASLQYVTN